MPGRKTAARDSTRDSALGDVSNIRVRLKVRRNYHVQRQEMRKYDFKVSHSIEATLLRYGLAVLLLTKNLSTSSSALAAAGDAMVIALEILFCYAIVAPSGK